MAIHAQKTTFRSSAQFPDFKVTSPIVNGDVLIYDENKRAFVNSPQSNLTNIPIVVSGSGSGSGSLNDAENLGTGAEVFKDIILDTLRFRTISGGPGITIDQDGFAIDEITIINDVINDSCISVPDSFKIEIDNDNTTASSAKFEIFTNASLVSTIIPEISATFNSGELGVFHDGVNSRCIAQASTLIDFSVLGFEAGMCLRVVGTDEQDGVWEIASIDTTTNTNDTITIVGLFTNIFDTSPTAPGALQPSAVLTGSFFKILSISSLQSLNKNFVDDGFVAGQTIEISGTSSGSKGTAFATTAAGQTIIVNGNTISLTTATGSAIETGTVGALYTNGETIVINTITVTLSTGISVADAVIDITAATIPGIIVSDVAGALEISSSLGPLVLAEGSGTALTDLGFVAGSTPLVTTVDDAVIDITAAAISGISAFKEDDALRITSTDTSLIELAEGTGIALAEFGLSSGTIVGGGLNDGIYTIGSISTTTTTNDTINIVETFSGALGCDIGAISIGIPSATISTGWWVDETGKMNATCANITGDLDVIGDTTIGGDLIVNGHLLDDIIINLLPMFPENGLITQISTDTFVGREIEGTNGIAVLDGDGISGNPTISADNFDIDITGDITGTGTVTGLSNTTISTTLPTITIAGTYNQVTVNAKGQVVSGATLPLAFQPASPVLDDLEDGMDNPGIVVWDGFDYIDREIDGTLNEIIITDGNGVSGNPIIGLSANPTIPGNESILITRGTTAQRPTAPVEGMFRYNQTDDRFEGFHDSTWEQFAHLNDLTVFLQLSGGTMTGNLILSGANIVMTGSETVDGRNISADGVILDAINFGTGIKIQTGPGTFTNRSIDIELNSGLTITDADGVAANPTVGFDITTIPDITDVVDEENDYLIIHDSNIGSTRKITPNQLIRPAFRYFFAQI